MVSLKSALLSLYAYLGAAGLKRYCPTAEDMEGGGELTNQGWSETGPNGVFLTSTINLLGGFIEFDMDLSKTLPGVNSNVYGVFPKLEGEQYNDANDYCDGQPGTQLFCAEIDFIEANGPVAFGATLHTVPQGYHGCDQAGCAADGFFVPPPSHEGVCNATLANDALISSAKPFRLRADFNQHGEMYMSISQDGKTITYSQSSDAFNQSGYLPNSNDRSIVKTMMIERGLLIKSTQWTGWVPQSDACPVPDPTAENSTFVVSNMVLVGRVVKGRLTECSESEGPLSHAVRCAQFMLVLTSLPLALQVIW
eukprot:TRINITY_DN11152_c0_g2_i2.p1 TRINITY_DN11152_c0_g2~~TRINITY_DN11152_c0_g2_i2.p1  ORF type:complete len:309 (-),score=53.57 TRINITY_DN11152_c0_g2_i2:146-1072(-)